MVNTNKTHYEKLQGYNFLTRWLHSARYKNILKIMAQFSAGRTSSEPIRILDIGCGTGKLYEILNEHFSIEYFGSEINPEFVEVTRKRYGQQPNFKITDQSATSGAFFAR